MNLLNGANGFPRRIVVNLNVPAEIAILRAMNEVEQLGADPKLTEAVMLLAKAKSLVADFIEGKTD